MSSPKQLPVIALTMLLAWPAAAQEGAAALAAAVLKRIARSLPK